MPSRSLDLPLRISISDISRGSRTNIVNVVGRVESGVLQLGDNVISEPGGNRGTVRSTASFCSTSDTYLDIASDRGSAFVVAGDVVTIGIHGIEQTALRYAICAAV